MGNKSTLKIKLTYVYEKPYWTVYQVRHKKFLWFRWEQSEYLALVSHIDWPRFKSNFEAHSGPSVEVIRDDF